MTKNEISKEDLDRAIKYMQENCVSCAGGHGDIVMVDMDSLKAALALRPRVEELEGIIAKVAEIVGGEHDQG